MNSESSLVLELWENVRDLIPPTKRLETATSMIRSFVEYGFDARDLRDVVDEEPYLTRAYRDVVDDVEEEIEQDEYNEDE